MAGIYIFSRALTLRDGRFLLFSYFIPIIIISILFYRVYVDQFCDKEIAKKIFLDKDSK